jgi:hypothetical protein
VSEVVSLRGDPIAQPGCPDADVIAEIEALLVKARAGEVIGITYAVVHSDGAVGNRFVGRVSRSQVGGLFAAMSRISRVLDKA